MLMSFLLPWQCLAKDVWLGIKNETGESMRLCSLVLVPGGVEAQRVFFLGNIDSQTVWIRLQDNSSWRLLAVVCFFEHWSLLI